MQDAIFTKVEQNILAAQEKQKTQYKVKRGCSICPFKVNDLVLQRNMLLKTKAGYKMQDKWLGPYTIVEVDEKKSVCRLVNSAGKMIARQVSLKNLKLYQQPDAIQPTTTTDTKGQISGVKGESNCQNDASINPLTGVPPPNPISQPKPMVRISPTSMHQPQPCRSRITNLPATIKGTTRSPKPAKNGCSSQHPQFQQPRPIPKPRTMKTPKI